MRHTPGRNNPLTYDHVGSGVDYGKQKPEEEPSYFDKPVLCSCGEVFISVKQWIEKHLYSMERTEWFHHKQRLDHGQAVVHTEPPKITNTEPLKNIALVKPIPIPVPLPIIAPHLVPIKEPEIKLEEK